MGLTIIYHYNYCNIYIALTAQHNVELLSIIIALLTKVTLEV